MSFALKKNIPTEGGDLPQYRALIDKTIVELLYGLKNSLTYLHLGFEMTKAVAAAVYALPHLKHAVQNADVPSVLCPRRKVEILDLRDANVLVDACAERMAQVYPALQRLSLPYRLHATLIQKNIVAFSAVTGLTALHIGIASSIWKVELHIAALAVALRTLGALRALVIRARDVNAPSWWQQLRAAVPPSVQLEFVHRQQDSEYVGAAQFRERPGKQE